MLAARLREGVFASQLSWLSINLVCITCQPRELFGVVRLSAGDGVLHIHHQFSCLVEP